MSDDDRNNADDQDQNGTGDTGSNDDGGKPAGDPPKPGTGDDKGGDKGTGDSGKPNGDQDGGSGGTDWRKHAKTWEGRAGEHKTAREKAERERDEQAQTLAAVRKAFGLDEDETDPEKVAEQAQATVAERDAEIRAMKVERGAEKAARKAGADVDALTDSRQFATEAAQLDPADDGFGDAMAALVERYVEDNPARFKAGAGKETPPPSSADMTGGGEPKGSASKDTDDMEEVRKRRHKRRGFSED